MNGNKGNGNKPVNQVVVSAESEAGSSVSGRIAPPPGQLKKADFVSDQEVRWCPGCGDYAILNNVQKVMPELGIARKDRVRFRYRLLVTLPLLHEHLRVSQHSRPRARGRDRNQVCQSRTERVGDHRRRRRPLDRRQSFYPRDPPQPRHQLHPLQQPYLRSHERPVQPDFRIRQANQVDAERHDRLPGQSVVTCDRQRVDLRRALDRHRRQTSRRDGRSRRET